MTYRRILLGLGLTAVVGGIALTLRPGLIQFDFATLLTLGIWGVALIGVALAVLERIDSNEESAGALPRAGERPSYDVPGDDLAQAVGAVGAGSQAAHERDQIRARLRRSAEDALKRFEAIDPDAAASRVEEGSWTDDPEAYALFAAENSGVHESVEPDFDHHAERAAAAVARIRQRAESAQSEQPEGVTDD